MPRARMAIVAEDDPDDHQLIRTGLEGLGFIVLSAKNSTEALDCLAGCAFPDLVVLDWYLEGPLAGNGPAQALIKDVLRSAVAPIAIITSEPERARENIPMEMPISFCTFYDKLDIDNAVRSVDEWAAKREFAFAKAIARSAASAMGRVTWVLCKQGVDGLDSWLANLESSHDVVEMLLRFSKREMEKELDLTKRLNGEIATSRGKVPVTSELLVRVLSVDRYYRPLPTDYLMCGDIFRDATGMFAILVNPACDLVESPERKRSATSAHLLPATILRVFIEGHPGYATETPDRRVKRASGLLKNQDPGGTGLVRVYGLPMVPVGPLDPYSEMADLVVQLDSPVVIPWEEFQTRYPQDSRVARLDSPFIEALLRQYSLFADRIGLRDVPDRVLEERGRLADRRPPSEHSPS